MKWFVFTIALMLAMATMVSAADITVTAAWSRPAITTGIVYLTVTNRGSTPDRLRKVTSPVAKAVELHQSMETKTPMGAVSGMSGNMSMAMGNVASMKPVAFVPIPVHGSVQLSPGGYHVMLVDLFHPLRAGQTFPIRMYFAHAPGQTVTVHVRAN